jgi:hypothetical protein
VESIAHHQDVLLQEARADSTMRAYSRWWTEFAQFVREAGEVTLPASVDVVSRFITWLDLEGKGGSVRVAMAAIALMHAREGHDSPCKGLVVKLVADGIDRVWS